MIKCFQSQSYPTDRLEWLILDDGTDKIGDLVAHLPGVKYFSAKKKMSLGAKRNFLHQKAVGEFFVYQDDDDFYPPERILHAIETLLANPTALCAGSSLLHIYFQHLDKIIAFGPYGPQHATAGTFAFRRALLANNTHGYDPKATIAEEKAFLKNYTVPFVQLDSKKTILVFSHAHNTFDKRRLLVDRHPQYVRDTELTVADFIQDPALREFYKTQLDPLLLVYAPGRPNMKPDVVEQMVRMERERKQLMQQMQAQQMQAQQTQQNAIVATLQQGSGPPTPFTLPQLATLLEQQQLKIVELTQLLALKEVKLAAAEQLLLQYKDNPLY